MALWSGRFEKGVSEFTQEFGASLPVDKAMYHQDIAGSRAHARMLAAQGVISEKDAEDIVAGLADIEKTIEEGNFTFDINDEDIHMSVEKVLTQNIGDAGARLHTGRSRNDQVITDTRLYAKELASELMADVNAMRETLIEAARKNMGTILPGYTHMQHAQPVLLSHHFMAYYWMFTRDFARLKQAFDAANANPLGSAALAGTTYPLDRQKTTDELGFDHMIPNSLDAVSDRDFLLHLGRRVLHGFVYHAPEEEPRLCRAHPWQVWPRSRRPYGAAHHHEEPSFGLQQGPSGRQGRRNGCLQNPA